MKNNENAIIGIYKITNPKGKVYIGQSVNIMNRWSQHKKLKEKSLLHRSLKKYGLENHKFEVVEECGVEQLNEKELFWTKHFNALHPNGLVLIAGGNYGVMSDIIKNKIRKSNLGKTLPQSSKDAIGKANKGNTNMLGKSHSDETKNKMRNSHLGKKDSLETIKKKKLMNLGRKKSKKWRNNISKSRKDKKIVFKYNKKGKFLKSYISINDASRKTGISVGCISACCNKKTKISHGFIWKFQEN